MTPLAERLLDHAVRIMPPSRRDWARGMRAEFAHIPTPAAATAFALGCVRASYVRRIQDMMTLALVTRWVFAAGALAGAGCYLLATALLGAVKGAPRLTPRDLGADPGTAETLRFFQGYPTWQVAALVLIAALLAAGAVLLLRRRPTALPVLASGLAMATVIAILDRGLLGAADWPLAWSTAWLIPLLCLIPVWRLSRPAPEPAH